ncbi:MAG: hypothetical protein U5R31_12790 [Acidimicrobiia bacterium]|nr:hypothetical protein [Acidimicrobiia bacterium]
MPTRRELVEDRHVEVAVHGHRRRSRDGRRRHHQHVGHHTAGVLLAQRRPLLDTEPVLLVDHHHAELVEVHRLLDERVGPHDEIDLARPPGRRAVARGVLSADPVR